MNDNLVIGNSISYAMQKERVTYCPRFSLSRLFDKRQQMQHYSKTELELLDQNPSLNRN